jgi:hypothetical protein
MSFFLLKVPRALKKQINPMKEFTQPDDETLGELAKDSNQPAYLPFSLLCILSNKKRENSPFFPPMFLLRDLVMDRNWIEVRFGS